VDEYARDAESAAYMMAVLKTRLERSGDKYRQDVLMNS
jgi:hypothetical protein